MGSGASSVGFTEGGGKYDQLTDAEIEDLIMEMQVRFLQTIDAMTASDGRVVSPAVVLDTAMAKMNFHRSPAGDGHIGSRGNLVQAKAAQMLGTAEAVRHDKVRRMLGEDMTTEEMNNMARAERREQAQGDRERQNVEEVRERERQHRIEMLCRTKPSYSQSALPDHCDGVVPEKALKRLGPDGEMANSIRIAVPKDSRNSRKAVEVLGDIRATGNVKVVQFLGVSGLDRHQLQALRERLQQEEHARARRRTTGESGCQLLSVSGETETISTSCESLDSRDMPIDCSVSCKALAAQLADLPDHELSTMLENVITDEQLSMVQSAISDEEETLKQQEEHTAEKEQKAAEVQQEEKGEEKSGR